MKNFKSYAGEQRVGPFHKAQACVELLRQGNLGVATFMILEVRSVLWWIRISKSNAIGSALGKFSVGLNLKLHILSPEINRCNVQIETNQKLIQKLTKGIEEPTREKERLEGEMEKSMDEWKASRMITLGGDAELELVDSLDPPKKIWKKIANLSGGEKTLSSLALVFALHHCKPTPL